MNTNTVKAILAVLALLSLSLASSSRAQMPDDMMCQGDMTTIASLRQCVEHAYAMGDITNGGVAGSLLAKLAAAQAAADRQQNAVAVHLLGAFVSEVLAQAGVHIDPMHAEHMVMHAAMVIQTLGG
jgi:hypothetical protein